MSDQKPIQIVLQRKWLSMQAQHFQDSQILKAYTYFRLLLWLGSDALMEDYPIKVLNIKSAVKDETEKEKIISLKNDIDLEKLQQTIEKKLNMLYKQAIAAELEMDIEEDDFEEEVKSKSKLKIPLKTQIGRAHV